MRSSFRLAIGSCSCLGHNSLDKTVIGVCLLIREKLELIKALNYEQIQMGPEQESEVITVHDREVTLKTFKESLPEGILVVVQGWYSTFKSPNYFGTNGIGKIHADGLIVKLDNTKVIPNDELVWVYR